MRIDNLQLKQRQLKQIEKKCTVYLILGNRKH